MSPLSTQHVISVYHWNDRLFSFRTTRDDALRFSNGQFVMLGVEHEGRPLTRAYSIASANHEEFLEFFSIKVPGGPLTSKLQHLVAGDDFLAFLDPEGVGLGHALRELCHGAGFEPRIAQRVSEIATMTSLVAAGFGVSLMADTVSHLRLPGVCYVPLAGVETSSKLIVVHRRFERSATVRGLLKTLAAAARATVPATQ